MTHPRYGRSHVHPIGQVTNMRHSDVLLTLMVLWGWRLEKILHYHQLYIDRPDPITFMSLPVDTSDHIYDDFLRLLFLHVHREVSTLVNVPEESRHFRFLHTVCLSNIWFWRKLPPWGSPYPLFSSVFCLNGVSWVLIQEFYRFSYTSYF